MWKRQNRAAALKQLKIFAFLCLVKEAAVKTYCKQSECLSLALYFSQHLLMFVYFNKHIIPDRQKLSNCYFTINKKWWCARKLLSAKKI